MPITQMSKRLKNGLTPFKAKFSNEALLKKTLILGFSWHKTLTHYLRRPMSTSAIAKTPCLLQSSYHTKDTSPEL